MTDSDSADRPEPAPSLAEDRAAGATVLLIVDMFSSWDFPDGDKLIGGAARVAPAIAALRQRCKAVGVPVVYANDNCGRWRSDFRDAVRSAHDAGGEGAGIARLLEPDPEDYFVLKPKHSAFFSTPLGLLMRHLHAERLVLTGVSSDQCILATAADARMLDHEVVVPADCVASQSPERERRAIDHLREVMRVDVGVSREMRLPGEARPGE